MTKITNELLEDYAMLYPRIECAIIEGVKIKPYVALQAIYEDGIQIEFVQLRSIESITDEELKVIFANSDKKQIAHFINCLMQYESDYLRSIGIATPFRGITVDELVESGKLKLI